MNEPDPVVLRGEGLVLREWRDDDLPHLPGLFGDPEVDRWTPLASPFDLAAAEAYLGRAWQRRRSGTALHLAITVDGERPLGEVLIFGLGAGDGSAAEVGYVVGPAHRGAGLAARAVRLLCGHAAATWPVQRLVMEIGVGNHASERVALAAGFVPTGEPPTVVTDKGREVTLGHWQRVLDA